MSHNPPKYQYPDPDQPANRAPYKPTDNYTTKRRSGLPRGTRNETGYYSPRVNEGYPPRSPPRSVIGDTKSLYYDGGSEISFDTSYEAPRIPAGFEPTASAEYSYAPTTPAPAPFKPANTIYADKVTTQSPTPAPPQIPSTGRDLAVKRYHYYLSRAESFVDVKDYVNAEECCTRAIDLLYQRSSISEVEKGNIFSGVAVSVWLRCRLKKWDEALAAIQLFQSLLVDKVSEGPVWLCSGLCAFMTSVALLGKNSLDEAESRARELLEISSCLLDPNAEGLTMMSCFENHAHKTLALIMAKRGDMLEAGFYKSLVSPLPATRDGDIEALFRLFEEMSDFDGLWESIK